MSLPVHPYRSVLYMPGSNARALEKARGLPADALILDLEDAVAPDQKATARGLVCDAVKARGYGRRKVMVRVNGLETPWGATDIAAAVAAQPDIILVPKAETGAQIAALAERCRDLGASETLRLWVMIETPLGILNAAEIAGSTDMLEGFVLGTNDLAKDLGAAHVPGRGPLIAALGLAVLAARAHGLVCVDGVFNAFRDEEGLVAECRQGLEMGFDGKSLIHPAQLGPANEVFAPSETALDTARAEIAAYEAATASGEGVAVLNGRIIENLHVETARAMLAKAAAIAEMGGQSAA